MKDLDTKLLGDVLHELSARDHDAGNTYSSSLTGRLANLFDECGGDRLDETVEAEAGFELRYPRQVRATAQAKNALPKIIERVDNAHGNSIISDYETCIRKAEKIINKVEFVENVIPYHESLVDKAEQKVGKLKKELSEKVKPLKTDGSNVIGSQEQWEKLHIDPLIEIRELTRELERAEKSLRRHKRNLDKLF